jgi:hypothetical protein
MSFARNPFQRRTWEKAEQMGLKPFGTPQADDKDILAYGGACVGLVLKECSDNKCFGSGLKLHKLFESKIEGQASVKDQAVAAARILGDESAYAEFVASKQVGDVLSEKTAGFSKRASFISIFNGKDGEHAIGFEVLGDNQCKLQDPNMGGVMGECNKLMQYADYLKRQEYSASSSAIASLNRR